MERQNKSLGFRLFGNTARLSESNEFHMDAESHFEIQFVPGEAPTAFLTQSGRYEEKRIDVEFPSEIQQSDFEKICTLLLDKNIQLIVKETGYEKLRNKKLILEIGHPFKNQLVNVIIFIKGKTNKINYEIELNPYDISQSFGEIQNQRCQVLLEDLKNVKEGEMKKIFPKLKPTNFQIEIKENQIIFNPTSPFKQFIDSIGKPTKYQNIRHNPVKKDAIYTVLMPNQPDSIEPAVLPRSQDPANSVTLKPEKVAPLILNPDKLLPAPCLSADSQAPLDSPAEEKPKGFFAKIWGFFFKS